MTVITPALDDVDPLERFETTGLPRELVTLGHVVP
jgi:hypothetical protein